MLHFLHRHILSATLLSLLFLRVGSAQEIQWGPVHKSAYRPSFIGQTKTHLFTAQHVTQKTYQIKTLEKNREFEALVNHKFMVKQEKGSITECIGLKMLGEFYVFVLSVYEKKRNKLRIDLHAFHRLSGEKKVVKKVFSLENIQRSKRGKFKLTASDDQTRLLIIHEQSVPKTNNHLYTYALINSNLQPIMIRELQENEQSTFPECIYIDDTGSVFFTQEEDNIGFQLHIFEANNAYTHLQKTIPFQTKSDPENMQIKVGSGRITTNQKGELVLAGYFMAPTFVKEGSNRQKQELRGTYFAKIDKSTFEIICDTLCFFDDAFFNQFRSDKAIEKGKSIGKRDIYHSNMMLTPIEADNKLILTGESVLYRNYSNQNGYITGESYEYGDIIALCFNDNGSLNWAHRFPKKQKFTWSTFFIFAYSSAGVHMLGPRVDKYLRHYSFFRGIINGNVVLGYYDDRKNPEHTENGIQPKTMNNVKTSALKMCTIDISSGQKNCWKVPEEPKNRTFIYPRSGIQSQPDADIVFYSKKGKKARYGIIHK